MQDMNECKLNVRINTREEIGIEEQIELVEYVKNRLIEVLPKDANVMVGREVSNEEIMRGLR